MAMHTAFLTNCTGQWHAVMAGAPMTDSIAPDAITGDNLLMPTGIYCFLVILGWTRVSRVKSRQRLLSPETGTPGHRTNPGWQALQPALFLYLPKLGRSFTAPSPEAGSRIGGAWLSLLCLWKQAWTNWERQIFSNSQYRMIKRASTLENHADIVHVPPPVRTKLILV